MIQENKNMQQAIINVYNNLKDSDYGIGYPWETLISFTGFPSETFSKEQIYHIMYKVNCKLMAENQRCMVNVHGIGKRIINPNEHIHLAKDTVKSASKKYRKAGNILFSTNMEALTQEEKNQVITDANKWRTLEMFTTELIRNKKLSYENEEVDKKSATMIVDFVKLFEKKKLKEDIPSSNN